MYRCEKALRGEKDLFSLLNQQNDLKRTIRLLNLSAFKELFLPIEEIKSLTWLIVLIHRGGRVFSHCRQKEERAGSFRPNIVLLPSFAKKSVGHTT